MKKYTIKFATVIAISMTVSACSSNSASKDQATQQLDTVKTAGFQLKDGQQDQLLKAYLNLKDALVLSDAAKAQAAAKQLQSQLQQGNSPENALKMADSIAVNSDLKMQRLTFTNLSNTLIPVFRKAALANGAFYVQFCPMANEGNGGYWLAAEEEVRNPYYGDEMLNCGEVKETIK